MHSSGSPKEQVCEFQDNQGPVAIRCSLIRSIYRIPEEDADFAGELTAIACDSVDENGNDSVDTFSVKTGTMEAIAEWKRQLAKMYG